MSSSVEQKMKRFKEQRWLLDQVIQVVGVEWDQHRLAHALGPCGPDATPDFMTVKNRIRKFSDISREFTRAAARRESMARSAEQEGRVVTARESYFIASVLYGSAQWPIYENTSQNLELNQKKVECYLKYARHADHEIKRVEIPFGEGKSLPGYLHLPYERSDTRVPCILSIGGMDSIKETSVAMYGDKILTRGMAVLALEGPGQGECTTRNIHVTSTNFMDAGRAALNWMGSQPEIDSERIALRGVSFGSFWSTQIAASAGTSSPPPPASKGGATSSTEGREPRIKACAVRAVCYEPGCNTIFNMASPTFKLRFMYMAGFEDEDEFDKFAQTLSLRGLGEKITCPYLALAGEDDQLSPIQYTYELVNSIKSTTKELVVYEGAEHGISGSPSTSLGPNVHTYIADWLKERLDGKSTESKHVFIDAIGQSHISKEFIMRRV